MQSIDEEAWLGDSRYGTQAVAISTGMSSDHGTLRHPTLSPLSALPVYEAVSKRARLNSSCYCSYRPVCFYADVKPEHLLSVLSRLPSPLFHLRSPPSPPVSACVGRPPPGRGARQAARRTRWRPAATATPGSCLEPAGPRPWA